MRYLVIALCTLTAAMGVLGIISPPLLENVIRMIQEPMGLYVVAGIRLLFGGSLIAVASASRVPDVLKVIGGILILTGITMPLLGVEHITEIINFWLDTGPEFLRVWGVITLLFGGLLIYGVTPGKQED